MESRTQNGGGDGLIQMTKRFIVLEWQGMQWKMASSGMSRRVALVRTDVSEELSTSFIRVTRIGELETTLALTSNRRTLVFIRS
jgi:3'-phosphoadenosine 5'-phosphosulfate sulfotransferase